MCRALSIAFLSIRMMPLLFLARNVLELPLLRKMMMMKRLLFLNPKSSNPAKVRCERDTLMLICRKAVFEDK